MKKILYLLSIPALMLVSCGGQNENKDSKEEPQDSLSYKMEESTREMADVNQAKPMMEGEKTEVNTGDLPEEITKKVKEDTLLANLKLEKVYMFKEGEQTHYDLNFKTEEGEALKVSFDEKGNLIEL